MKLLYLLYGNYLSQTPSGVDLKILSKIKALRELGVEVGLVVFSRHAIEKTNPNDYTTLFPVDKTDSSAYKTIAAYLKEKSNLYNKIIFRYPAACPDLLNLVKEFKDKIFFEHNTFETEEARLVQERHFKTLSFSLKPSYLQYWYKTYILRTNPEKELRSEILTYAHGGICVTKELAAYEVKNCPPYKTFVVSNGAEAAVEALTSVPEYKNTLKAFILVGDNAPWQGTERIIKGLQKFNDKSISLLVTVIGLENKLNVENLPANCKVNFSKNSQHFFKENNLADYHISFSTLALYRKGMQEAASLKLRDCMMRGFPVVLAYTDTDVTDNELFNPYTLHVPNDDTPLDFSRVKTFYESVRKIENYPQIIRELALKTFSYEVKAKQLKEILENN
jgi:hypothetical protein